MPTRFLDDTQARPFDLFESIGSAVLEVGEGLGDALYLLANSLGGLRVLSGPRGRYFWRSLIQQLYFTAVQAFWLANVIGFALGVLAVLPLLRYGLSALGVQTMVMRVVLFQQLVPLLVALVVIGRSGTAVTAELGDMQSNAVIDSLLMMGIEPHHFLILPRLVGITLALLLLTTWAAFTAVVGGGLFNHFNGGASFIRFAIACIGVIEPLDVGLSALMVVSFGMAIAVVQCQFGLRSHSGPETQRNLPRAFVRSLVACIVITLFFALVRR